MLESVEILERRDLLSQEVNDSNCFISLADSPSSTFNLFYFHFAGGAASFFRPFARKLNQCVSSYGVQLPGREQRHRESFITSIDEMIKQLAPKIALFSDKPMIFLGHSMGALIAFELSFALEHQYGLKPRSLILSAKKPPQLIGQELTSHLSDDELIDKLKYYQGTPSEILADEELIRHFLPRLRADTLALDTYHFPSEGRVISSPIIAVGGDCDPLVSINNLYEWQALTTGKLIVQSFRGGHFYLMANMDEFIKLLNEIINGLYD